MFELLDDVAFEMSSLSFMDDDEVDCPVAPVSLVAAALPGAKGDVLATGEEVVLFKLGDRTLGVMPELGNNVFILAARRDRETQTDTQ